MRNDREESTADWKKGVLITNAFLRTDKFVEHYEWLRRAAKQYHIALSLLDNTALLHSVPSESTANLNGSQMLAEENDFILYWDKDRMLGGILQSLCDEAGVPVFNSVLAVGLCDNKFETFRKLWEWNRLQKEEDRLAFIPTIAAPMTYENIGYTTFDFVDRILAYLGLPVVIKECYGSFGMQVYLAKSREEVLAYTKRLAGKPFLYQKYIKESSGRDVRLQVVGDNVVAAMYRYSETGDFRANITNGGSMKQYHPSSKECELAIRTVKALGLDFAGVDLLFSKGEVEGADIVCEVNSNAHFKNIYTCTGVNVAECIMEYIRGKIDA